MAEKLTVPEFVAPDFIAGNSPEEIQERMMKNLPSDIDNMPGGFPYDFTMPTALEKSEMIQFHLIRTLMLMFPMWAWDNWLDYHAQACGLTRKAAARATCKVRISGKDYTKIAAGTKVATAATSDSSSLYYSTMEDCEIRDGTVEVYVQADEGGTKYNVPAGTIVIQPAGMKEITGVVNIDDATGGTEAESDEELRERIQQANESDSASFVGSDSDYIRWAKEVEGVGDVMVVPEAEGPGTVKLVIEDANGDPANSLLIKAVEDYIVSPNDRINRKAPIGAQVTVVAPTVIQVAYTATVMFTEGYDKEGVSKAFQEALKSYYPDAKKDGVLKYIKVSALLAATMGVSDFTGLKMNGSTDNIPVDSDEALKTSTVTFEEASP